MHTGVWMWKSRGSFNYDFFQGFLLQGIFSQEVNLHSYLFQGGRMIIFFRYHLILRNQIGKDSIPGDLWVMQSFFPWHIGFEKFGRPYPCMKKNGIAQYEELWKTKRLEEGECTLHCWPKSSEICDCGRPF